MGKYLINRLLRGLGSIILVVAIIMVLIYSLMDRQLIFANDSVYRNLGNNQQTAYKYRKWQEYGYMDYVTYADYLKLLEQSGEISADTRSKANSFGKTEKDDSALVSQYVKQFKEYYESQGYSVVRLPAVMASKTKLASGGQQQLFAYKDRPLLTRLWKYLTGIITIDNIHKVENIEGKRGLTFTLFDPVANGKFSPAIMGNGTLHKYLLYFDSRFPFVHQNLITISLGTSYTVNQGIDVFETMNKPQGSYVQSQVTYPTGLTEMSADDLHSAIFVEGSRAMSKVFSDRFTDDYTNVTTVKSGKTKIGYSFTIGIIAVVLAYLVGLPLGVVMARKKDKLIDKIGSIYIVFIIAVPSLAYIFLFKAVGGSLGFPTTFDMQSTSKLMYFLPMISLALPSIAGLMKWLRRYMIDQMNSDYVKFARSGGLSEREIFSKHILKNAAIPIVHGIPSDLLFAMTGAIITERVYVVPGAGGLLTTAINAYDNGVIVGVALFYALLSVVAMILGDLLMSAVDPRISYTTKGR